jgi:hypothetical protein
LTDPHPAHAWAAIIKRNPTGKGTTVIFWDPDALWRKTNLNPGYTGVTTRPQRNLVDELKKTRRVDELWYGGHGNEAGEECVRLTMEFLADLMEKGLPDDLEEAGYTRYI